MTPAVLKKVRRTQRAERIYIVAISSDSRLSTSSFAGCEKENCCVLPIHGT